MSMALCLGLVRSLAGHTLTHSLQPVQSSGATWIVYRLAVCSLPLYGGDLKVGGAPATAPSSYTFARMAACGHTTPHSLHWMQTFGSHTGISSARFRFSHFAVPTGQVPSTGNALTGSRSPLPASITAVTFCTKSGQRSEKRGRR